MERENYNFRDEIIKHIKESTDVKHEIIDKHVNVINEIAGKFIDAYNNHNKVIWFGNGGSAADAQHLSCELVSKFIKDRKAIPSIALTTNTSILTSVSNDYSYDKVFERQVEAFAEKGDILVGITTSGTSPNIIRALKLGKEKGTINIAFTGNHIDEIKDYVDFLVDVPSKKTPRIQESHIMIGHIICELVETTLFEEQKMVNKAVFIDRDGTININVEYLDSPDDLQVYPGVADGIKLLRDNGFKIIVVTNQSGIARGHFSEGTLEKIHERMKNEFAKKGASVDGIYYCPHHPDDGCSCRKPNTGLLERAIKDFDIDVNDSFIIGDRMLDVEAGHKMGLKTVLVPEKKGLVEEEMKESKIKSDYVCDDFYTGVRLILDD